MKVFESFLSPQLDEFIAYRKNLGYETRRRRAHLLAFDRYLKDKGADWSCFEPSFFLRMRSELGKQPAHTNQILMAARIFFRFLMRLGYVEENPLQDVPLLKEKTVIPFLFSREQTNQLLAALCKRIRRKETYFLKDLGTYLVLLLLARCGMRISEPLGLMVRHYRRDDATLYIEKTKFGKHRLIPIPKAVITEIDNYLCVRKHLKPDDQNPYLLAGQKNRALNEFRVRSAFHRAVEDLGLMQQRKTVGNMIFNPPVPHGLRHYVEYRIMPSGLPIINRDSLFFGLIS